MQLLHSVVVAMAVIIALTSRMQAAGTDKITSTPDLSQTDPAGAFEGDGSNYCAPVAISNSLMYLSRHGFPDLASQETSTKDAQIEVVHYLASPDYLKTDANSGTNPAKILIGLTAYLADCGYGEATLEYEGWREVSERFDQGAERPDLDWLRAGIDNPTGAVWLNVGWYKYNSDTDEYYRVGGHWVTLVGHGVDADGEEDPAAFVIHNPLSKNGNRVSHDIIYAEQITSGTLTATGQNRLKGLPRSAKGYYEIHRATRHTRRLYRNPRRRDSPKHGRTLIA